MPKSSAIALCCFSLAQGFTPVTRIFRHDTTTFVTRLSEIEDESSKEPAWKKFDAENAGFNQKSANGVNPDNYEGLIDGDSFDGGDGQVGCVGDGSNAMESFDESGTEQVSNRASARRVPVREGQGESKKQRSNVFGMTTGYAEKLKEQGMTKVDEYGDDMLHARRQQLENWGNQRELKKKQIAQMQEISDYTGVEYDERRATQSYMNVLGKKGPMNDNAKFNIIQGDGAGTAEATELSTDLTKGPITETLTITCAYPKPTFYELKVYNDAMSYEHFKVGWAPESVNGGSDFQVTPVAGELNRRGGEPTSLSLTFKPSAPGGEPRVCYLVVETEESKFTYEILGNVE